MTDLIKDMLTSLTLRRNAISTRNECNHYINYINIFGTGKMQLCSSDDLGLFKALSEPYCVAVSFPIKYVKYDSMVN